MSKVEIYTTMLCGYCGAAKRLLNKKGVEFIEYDVMFKSGLRGEMMERSGGATSVPQIFIGDTHVGGSDDLAALEKQGKLEPLLAG